jgi:hypothetical protein
MPTSHYDRERGILTITLDDLWDYHRTRDRPEVKPAIEYYVEKLNRHGYDVVAVHADSLEVRATHNEIWEVLSGQHSYL